MEAIDRAHVVILCLDARDGVTAQDARIAGMAHEKGRGLILLVNKWDLLHKWLGDRENCAFEVGETYERRLFRSTTRTAARDFAKCVRDDLPFATWAPVLLTTAITGSGVDKVLTETALVAEHHAFRIPTPELNRIVREAIDAHPPTRHGQKLKVLYSTQARVKPPTFVFFVNDPELVHFSFERHIENKLREAYNFEGTPLRLRWRARHDENDKRPRSRGPGRRPSRAR